MTDWMHQIRTIATAITAVVTLCMGSWRTANAQSLAATADSLFTGGFEGVIMSGDSTGLLVGLAHGRAQRTPLRPHRTDTVWPWASVTKQVTAVLVMMEVERGTMTLESSVAELLPSFRGTGAAGMTVRQLLQHTTGLPNPDAGTPDDAMPPMYLRPTIASRAIDEANQFCSGPTVRAPGEAFDYNNCDYIVLGAILEARTGMTYATLLRTRIAEPLGLRSLRLADTRATRQTRITGYLGTRPAPRANLATYGAAGALIGTPDDLLRFDDALMAGKLLRPASLTVLWQGEPRIGYVALGAWSFTTRLAGCAAPVALVERRGDIGDVQVRNLIAPAQRQSLVVFTNDGTFDFGELWQGKGAGYALASAAFCGQATARP
jgi:CubicO group peptidase (beta-lactamase class C family)